MEDVIRQKPRPRGKTVIGSPGALSVPKVVQSLLESDGALLRVGSVNELPPLPRTAKQTSLFGDGVRDVTCIAAPVLTLSVIHGGRCSCCSGAPYIATVSCDLWGAFLEYNSCGYGDL